MERFQTAQNAPQPASPLQRHVSDLNGRNERIGKNVARLTAIAERLCGTRPEADGKGQAPTPVPNGRLDELHQETERLDNLLLALEAQIERLDGAI